MDDDENDRKPTREEKEQAKALENLQGDKSEEFLMEVLAERAAAASKSVNEDDDMSKANRDDINISHLLHQLQEEDKEECRGVVVVRSIPSSSSAEELVLIFSHAAVLATRFSPVLFSSE